MKFNLPPQPKVRDLMAILFQCDIEADISIVVPNLNGFRIDTVRSLDIPKKLGPEKKNAGDRSVVLIETEVYQPSKS